MSDVLRVKWTILAENPPQPLLHCSRCNGTSNFRTSDRIRVNTNGKRIDAWLIYKCASCDNTWNRPILERRHLRSIDPLVLAELQGNDPKRARRVALDVEDLKRRVGRVVQFDEVVVRKEAQSPSIAPTRQVEIHFFVPHSTACRLDRLLAGELRLSRSQVQGMEKSGELVVVPPGSRALRSSVRNGMRLTITVSPGDANRIAEAALGGQPATRAE